MQLTCTIARDDGPVDHEAFSLFGLNTYVVLVIIINTPDSGVKSPVHTNRPFLESPRNV